MHRILIWLGDGELAVPWGPYRITCCRNAVEFSAAVGSDAWDCVVVDVRLVGTWLGCDGMRVSVPHIPLVLRTSIVRAQVTTLTVLARYLTNARLSLRGHSVLRTDVDEVLDAGGRAGPDMLLLRELGDTLHGRVRPIVPAVLALSRRRTTVRELSRACHVPVRTMEWLLRRSGGFTPRWHLGWGAALYTVWRMEVLGWSFKRAAGAAGATDPGVLARYVERYTGQRPGYILRTSGFRGLVTAWRSQLLGGAEVSAAASGPRS